ncbi:MAG: hypothetical protein LBV79_09720 [Candidatus Adiutrix sp.]|jgi:hypothetical protein|nr:hypothetical protein [Candidatus Adiutrix sp.]
MLTDNYDKQLLYRRGNCKQKRGRYLKKIHDLCNLTENIDFIDLRESDAILHNAKIPVWDEATLTKSLTAERVGEILRFVKEKYHHSFYVFIDHDWEFCGTFLLPSFEFVNDNFDFRIPNTITDDIVFVSFNLGAHIHLEYEENNVNLYEYS